MMSSAMQVKVDTPTAVAPPHFGSASTAAVRATLTTFPIFAQACSPVRWFDLLLLVDILLRSTLHNRTAIDKAEEPPLHCTALCAVRAGCRLAAVLLQRQ